MSTTKIGFIGAGKMAYALLRAMLDSHTVTPRDLLCSDIDPEPLEKLAAWGIATTPDNAAVVRSCDIVFLAFKPQGFPHTVEPLTPLVRPDQKFVSIMAGIRIAALKRVLPARIIRIMPNTPCLVGQMAAGLATDGTVPPADIERIETLLRGAGVTCRVTEDQLDAVTGLSGSGPAFVASLIQAFLMAGVEQGLPESIARQLTLQTFSGTAQLLTQWQMAPADLIAMVSSPNGTTVAGRAILESSDVAEIISQTVARAAQRSRELSGS